MILLFAYKLFLPCKDLVKHAWMQGSKKGGGIDV
jgi:hypothetical protein